jgi:hypothetical protein
VSGAAGVAVVSALALTNAFWGAATPYILAVYGITAAGVAAAVVLSLRELERWARRSRTLEQERELRDR